MTKTAELNIAIEAKRAELTKAYNSAKSNGNFTFASSLADELNSLLDQYDVEKRIEATDFANFIRTARPLNDVSPREYNGGVAGDEYRQSFLNAVRHKFRNDSTSYLREGTPAMGGYLVPTEFGAEILSKLEAENVLRQIGSVITTASEHKIAVVATPPSATWVSEAQNIETTAESFNQLSLGAYKLAAAITVSNELLFDSYYNIEEHLTIEFAKALARAEEDTFLNGDGDGKPAGILPSLATNSDSYVTGRFSEETYADDLVKLQYSVPRAYRRNASWLISEELIQNLRKAKDTTGRFMWQDSLSEGEPPMLLGNPVYTSPFFPQATTGNIPMLYGDFSYFKIAERGTRTMKALREVYALQDMTAFLMIERVDGLLVDTNAVKGLKIA